MQNEEIDPIAAGLAAAETFLRQQQSLYGNIIYRSPAPETVPAESSAVSSVDRIQPPVPVSEPPVTTPESKNIAPAREPFSEPARVVTEPRRAAVKEPIRTVAAASAAAATPALHEPWQDARTLAELNAAICTCQKCPLGATRTKFVFGVGRPDAGVMVIGEAPGADEDATGEPFVGRAGQLLNKILEAVSFAREEVFIANILKCRPPNNRKPAPAEVELCEPYLWSQIELVKPKIILCLGLTAAQTLLRSTASLGVLREQVQTYRGIPLIVTYHPAALLRNPNWKRPTWEDVQKLRKLYDDIIAAG